MSRPITWQNISGPDPKAAMLPMALASQTLGNAFSGLKDTFNEYQTGVKDRNTNAALDALYSQFGTVEALDAGMKDGTVQRLLSSFGKVDSEKLRGAPGERLTQLLGQHEAQDKYTTGQQQKAQEGDIAKALMQISLGNEKEGYETLQGIQGLVNPTKVLDDAREAQKDVASLNETTQRTSQSKTAHDLDTRTKTLTVEEQEYQAGLTEEGRKVDGTVQEYFNALNNLSGNNHISPEHVTEGVQKLRASLLSQGYKTDIVDAALTKHNPKLTEYARTYGPEAALEQSQLLQGEWLLAEAENRRSFLTEQIDRARSMYPEEGNDTFDNITTGLSQVTNRRYDFGGGKSGYLPTRFIHEALSAVPFDNMRDDQWKKGFEKYIETHRYRSDVVAEMEAASNVGANASQMKQRLRLLNKTPEDKK